MTILTLLHDLFTHLPPGAADAFFGATAHSQIWGPWSFRRDMQATLTRILTYSGQEPSPRRVAACIEEAVFHLSRMMHLLAYLPSEQRFIRDRVQLLLLPEVERLRAEGNGVVIATPHFGMFWHAILALHGRLPWHVPLPRGARFPHYPPELQEHIWSLGSCALPALESLRANEVFVSITDFNLLPHRRPTLFFGAPADLGYGAARIALAAGAPILPAYAFTDDGFCRFEADKAIHPGPNDSLFEVTERLARSMERAIGSRPGQWLGFNNIWSPHRRPLDRRFRYEVAWPPDLRVENGELQR